MSNKRINLEYCLIHAVYWAGHCVSFGFAAVFLQERGYTNTELGLVLAAGNVAGFVVAPILAELIDRYEKMRSSQLALLLLGIQALCLAVLWRIPGRCALVSACYCVYLVCVVVITPLVTELSIELGVLGWRVNFGFARGLGALTYGMASIVVGYFANQGVRAVFVIVGLTIVFAQLAVVSVIDAQLRRAQAGRGTDAARNRAATSSLLGFIRYNSRYCVLMLGVALLFFSHNLMNSYFINIVHAVGGDTADMGKLTAYFTVIEAPVMFAFAALARRFSCSALLRMSTVAFVLKALCIALSGSIPALYAAVTIQIFGYSILIPALVMYATLYVSAADSAKAQAISASMATFGAIFAGFVGGLLLDVLSVRATLLIATAVAALGAAVCQLGIEKPKHAIDRTKKNS